ncbi:hypothetical protein F5148DRAFT_1006664 [Russula earlei]|uniref:Uncharacterized protein n=1 Tax=Russula earlei TaxID=71964 RepID=A0ACC0URU8_9AGAM|nr:hypothetical protein F5148DRAFT_1006664 [Russula earlei]
MDGSEFGSYGVLRFMRRHEETIIASYPIDDDELTFGCDPSCSVRLYYPTVSPLHAKIIFQDRKAFIQAHGVHGLLVDNCRVFPVSTTTPTTVPLTNNSELEISKKRFRFEYPPKALRPVLAFATPPQPSTSSRRRVLRLSMIQSAQVFTPRPDPDPHVNLRVLQTPIRLNGSPSKHAHRTPRQAQTDRQEGEYGMPIRLVEGNHPQVVEEEQDLVILEEVDVPERSSQVIPPSDTDGAGPSGSITSMQNPTDASQMGGSHPAPAFPFPPSNQQFQTPLRRPGRPSLHRAVLIRSAQRAAIRIEMEKEQEQEEREVEEHILPVDEQMKVDEEGQAGEDAVMAEFYEDLQQDDDGEDVGPDPEPKTPVFGWRKGLEVFKNGFQALRSRSRSPEKNVDAERDFVEARSSGNEYDHSLQDNDDQPDQELELLEHENERLLEDVPPAQETRFESDFAIRAASVPRQFTPQRPQRPLLFMTPQVPKANRGLGLADRVRGRTSTGSVGRASFARSLRDQEIAIPDVNPSTPSNTVEPYQRRINNSERQAIQERRRSALAQPDMFFGGGIPGSRRNSLNSSTPGAKAAANFVSPSKAWTPIREDEEEAETTTLLEKMKEVVEGMQRRRSIQTESIANVSIPKRSEKGEKDVDQQDEALEDDEATTEEPVPIRADSRSVAPTYPATPHMSDLRHVFSEKHAANIPPSYAGVRTLFKMEHAPIPETPRLDGLREIFFLAREREPSTPIFEDVGEMLATPQDSVVQEITESNEVEMDNTGELHASSPSSKRSGGKPMDSGHPVMAGSRIPAKTTGGRRIGDGRATPSDAEQLADDGQMSDIPPAKPLKQSANIPKSSVVRRTDRRAENEAKEDTDVVPSKSARKARKVNTPEVPEHAPTPRDAVIPDRLPGRRSRTATKSTDSTTESGPAEPTKSTRSTMRGTKAGAASAPSSEPVVKPGLEAEPPKGARRGVRKRSQSVEVAPAPAPAPATTKRRVGAKSKVASTRTQDATAEDGVPLDTSDRAESSEEPRAPITRGRRGKTKPAAETTEDEGTGTLRVGRGRRTPTGIHSAAAGAASNRVAGGKGRGVAAPSGKKAARAVVEKENTPERIDVKVEEDEKAPLPAAATKGARARKATGGAAKAQSEPENDATSSKTRAPRTRTASGRK